MKEDTLKSFAELARRFCDWAEKGTLTAEDAHQYLADLHASILRVSLPVPDTGDLPS